MATALKFSDEWVAALKHPARGEPENIFPDPTLPKMRLVVSRNKKTFEVQAERPKRYGPRKTYKVQVGDAPMAKVHEARAKAIVVLRDISEGKVPSVAQAPVTTLGAAWERFKSRGDFAPATLKGYESGYRRRLSHWNDMALQTLSHQPMLAEDLHKKITDAGHGTDANRALKLLRAIYFDAAQRDRNLSREHHPCTSVRWATERPREAAIPSALLPTWAIQLEKLREISPIRASYHKLCLLLGTRPGELARAKWSDYDAARGVLVMPDTKTDLYEIPLSTHAMAEFERAREVGKMLYPDSDWIFPADSTSGHLARSDEPKKKLSHTGNAGRHTFKTQATILGVPDLHSDVLQGRSLLKAGLAGRGYIGRAELTEPLRKASQMINDEMERLMTVHEIETTEN
ncbi:MAG: hypothetical protein ACREGR_02610 [Minisyncoccia bacterium]